MSETTPGVTIFLHADLPDGEDVVELQRELATTASGEARVDVRNETWTSSREAESGDGPRPWRTC